MTEHARLVQHSMLKVCSLESMLGLPSQGYGYAPEEVVSIGAFPALEELHLSDMLEGDAGPGGCTRSRFHMPHSLTKLQVRAWGTRMLMKGQSCKTFIYGNVHAAMLHVLQSWSRA